ncbi:MAG: NfeD family protein [Pyrinomonadaceae bacterium]|nr:NfeD family protein [Pyrinomonadaceae bacterium]
MEQYTWVIWLVLSVVLIVAEIFTLGFFLFWFGIGALSAALIGLFGLGLTWQFLTFAVVSTVLTILSRTLFSKYLFNSSDEVKMGADSLPGMIGTVTSASRGALNAGAVKVYGSEWTAFPMDGETPLTEGEKVEVVSVKGSSIYVRSLKKEIPGWKQE